MFKHDPFRTCIGGALLALAGHAVADERDEQEVLLDCQANFQPYLLEYGMTAINGSISPSTDIKTFVFLASGGETVDICLDAVGPCTYWDPFFRVLDPANTQVGSGSCGTDCYWGPSSCSVCVTVTDLAPGIHTILVSDSGTDNTGEFRLHIEEVVPTRSVPVLPYSWARLVTLGPTTDNDWLRFFGKAGSTIQVLVDQQGACTYIDPRYTLYDPNGSVIDSGACDTDCYWGPDSCSISRQVTLDLDGVYTLRLRDGGEDDAGTVLVSVQCLFGCPPLNQHLSRNGSGTNPATYEVEFPAVYGECWTATVDASDHPGATSSFVILALGPGSAAPIATRWGELLLTPGAPSLCRNVAAVPQPPAAPIARHSATIPTDPALLGVLVSSQAVTFGGGLAKLRNAIDYRVGY